jgi:UDP-N-acetylglucosamine 4,6-dehydratase/5-epimerase
MSGGELFVPRIPSTKVVDLARRSPRTPRHDVIGIRPGEKLHEEMISIDDARRTYEYDDYYVIAPLLAGWTDEDPFEHAKPVPDGFAYRSDTNDQWLDVDELSALLGH